MTDARTRALALRLDGQSCITIARTLGLSRQRVQQMLTPPAAIRDHVIRAAKGRCAGCGIICGRHGQTHDTRTTGTMACDEYDDLAVLEWRCASCHRGVHQ